MKRLCDIVQLKRSACTALLISLACLPYLIDSAVRHLEIAFAILFVTTMIMWQVYRAWFQPLIPQPGVLSIVTDRRVQLLAFGYLPFVILQVVWFDQWFACRIPGFKPEGFREFVILESNFLKCETYCTKFIIKLRGSDGVLENFQDR